MPILIGVGDSITYGNWDSEGGWLERFREYLDQRILSIYQRVDLYSKHYTLVYNLGIPGETTEGLLERLERELKPRINRELENIIIFAIGVNDSRYYEHSREHAVDFNVYQKNLPKLFEIAKKYTGKIVFVGLMPVDEKRTDPIFWETQAFYRNAFVKRYDKEIRDFCEKEGVHFIEIFDKLIGENIEELLEDGIHPNNKGHQRLFEIIKAELEDKKVI